MPVYKSHSQGGPTADPRDRYRNREDDPHFNYPAMVALIDRLDAEFPRTDIWILTSLESMGLMDCPTYDGGDSLVTVHPVSGEEHLIDCLLPASRSPFPKRAEIRTVASGLEEAVKVIRIAMRESGGWRDSTELGRRKHPGDTPPSTLDVLESMFQRPAMYWGNHTNHFHGFVAFTDGYGMYNFGRDAEGYSPLDKVIPEGFSGFVAKHFGEDPHSTAGWPFVIERHSKSGQEALELFLKLRKLHDEKHPGN